MCLCFFRTVTHSVFLCHFWPKLKNKAGYNMEPSRRRFHIAALTLYPPHTAEPQDLHERLASTFSSTALKALLALPAAAFLQLCGAAS